VAFRGAFVVVLLGASVAVPMAAAAGGSLGTATVAATPAFVSPVSAVDGALAWAAPSGTHHRFEVVVRSGGRNRPLSATSAVGWIDGVKLGTDSAGRTIVVYSHCPHSPFANATPGHAGTDGCRLWWARTNGAVAHRISAAPADTSVGVAVEGTLFFAVQPNTADASQPAQVETVALGAGTPQALTVPTPGGATIDDISAAGTAVAFSEAPVVANQRMGVSEIWLDSGSAAPLLIAKVTSDTTPVDDAAQFFDGLTLTGSNLYAFLYSQAGVYPAVASQLEQIALPGLATSTAAWTPSTALSAYEINASSFDPSSNRLALGLFSGEVNFSKASAACSTHAGSARACPVVQTGPVTFG
jgi:hypothetical protein